MYYYRQVEEWEKSQIDQNKIELVNTHWEVSPLEEGTFFIAPNGVWYQKCAYLFFFSVDPDAEGRDTITLHKLKKLEYEVIEDRELLRPLTKEEYLKIQKQFFGREVRQ
jgi:hypothetical protein